MPIAGDIEAFYVKSPAEMAELFPELEEREAFRQLGPDRRAT